MANNVNNLPPGPYQLTNSRNPTGPLLTYDDYAESPVHRFYQMWQQLDCIAVCRVCTCLNDLFPWVEATVGAGSNGKPPPANFTYKEGATAMGFYNVQQGDVPYFKTLADTYSMSDNFHQSVEGGTGANHIMLGTGDAIWFSDSNGNPLTPPHNEMVAAGSPNAGIVDEIENPNPLPAPTTGTSRTAMAAAPTASLLRRRQLHGMRGHFAAGCPVNSELSELGARKSELPARVLLSAQQLQSWLLRRRHQRLRRYQQSPKHGIHHSAIERPEHRRCSFEEQYLVRLFRRPVQRLPRQSV